jgi:hypothetical protein
LTDGTYLHPQSPLLPASVTAAPVRPARAQTEVPV